MGRVDSNLLQDLRSRGLISQMTGDDAFEGYLQQTSRTVYCGFDPTADSLHIGSLVPLLALKRFQEAGHIPIVLVGGATGLIGDPSFKAQERKLNTPEVIETWVDKLKAQTSRFVDFEDGSSPALIVNNLDWVGRLSVLDFLRDVGKHFSINNMINKESVKQRINREGSGISFTEFSYMILQSYDFAELYKRHHCTLQIGGSDQWGNITGGIDLVRRLCGGQAFGMTLPLVTKTDGSKFGKTESGTVWLDAQKTSPYAFYQFWMNTADTDVYRFLRYFTFLAIETIQEIEENDEARNGRPEAQKILAEEVTRLVHGSEGLTAAQRISAAMFSGQHAELSETDWQQLQLDGLPSSQIQRSDLEDKSLSSLLVECQMAKAAREVKDALGRKAVSINGIPKNLEDNMRLSACFSQDLAIYGRFFLVKLGKKKNHLFEIR